MGTQIVTARLRRPLSGAVVLSALLALTGCAEESATEAGPSDTTSSTSQSLTSQSPTSQSTSSAPDADEATTSGSPAPSDDPPDVQAVEPSTAAAPVSKRVCPKEFFEVPAGSPRGGDAPRSSADLEAAIDLFSQPGSSWGCIYVLPDADDTLLTDGVWERVTKPLKLKKKWSNEASMVDQLGASARPGARAEECHPAQGNPLRFVYARRSAAGTAHAVVDAYGCRDVRVVADLGSRDLNNDDALLDIDDAATAEALAELNARMAAG